MKCGRFFYFLKECLRRGVEVVGLGEYVHRKIFQKPSQNVLTCLDACDNLERLKWIYRLKNQFKKLNLTGQNERTG